MIKFVKYEKTSKSSNILIAAKKHGTDNFKSSCANHHSRKLKPGLPK